MNGSKSTDLKQKQNREKQQIKWRRLRSVSGKRKLKSILAVEYTVNGMII